MPSNKQRRLASHSLMATNLKDNRLMLLTIEEAAEYLRFHPSTVYRLARSGQLPAKKVGKQWRLHRESLESWLRGNGNVRDETSAHKGGEA